MINIILRSSKTVTTLTITWSQKPLLRTKHENLAYNSGYCNQFYCCRPINDCLKLNLQAERKVEKIFYHNVTLSSMLPSGIIND